MCDITAINVTDVTHRYDEGEVDADGEVGNGQHVRAHQLQELDGLDELLELDRSPAHRYQRV